MPRDPLDPSDLQKRAAALRENATRLLLEAELYESTAKARALILERQPENPRQEPIRRRALSPGRALAIATTLTRTDHPFPRAVLSKYRSIVHWAEEHGYSHKAVRSWYAVGTGARAILPEAAERIAQEFPEIPATEEVWKNGIQRPRRHP